MLGFLRLWFGLLVRCFRSHRSLLVENLALRQRSLRDYMILMADADRIMDAVSPAAARTKAERYEASDCRHVDLSVESCASSRCEDVMNEKHGAACGPTRTPASSEQGSWRWCAEDYFQEIWWPQDRRLVREFAGTVTCAMLHELCVLYRVARTIPGNGLAKYQPFVDILNRHRHTVLTRTNTAFVIESELMTLHRAYSKQPLSALTKAFWMMKQHPVVVYDSYAWKGLDLLNLAPGYDRYGTYYAAWFRFFDRPQTQNGLDLAVRWLPECPFVVYLVSRGQIDSASLKQFTESSLFRNRIVDRWLTYKGGMVQFT